MFSYWAYILIGNDLTGKTSFQRYLVRELCGQYKARLRTNLVTAITHPAMPRGVETLSTMNRSYQEKIRQYGTVHGFFANHFKDADICILSSHTHQPSQAHIEDIIRELRLRAYNVAAVFFSNGYDTDAEQISLLDWDERLWIENPLLEKPEDIQAQLALVAVRFANLLIARAARQ